MSQNNFSVAMCVYGGDDSRFFEAAVASILNQTIMPSEVVVVVDGPVPPGIDNVLKKYESVSLFKIVRFCENQGHGNARRASVDACSNEIVALMDADDISLPDRFEQQLQYMLNDDIDIVGGDISEFVGDENNIIGFRKVPVSDADIRKYMKKRCPFNQGTVMFRKTVYNEAGGYVDWYCDEDYYLWLRMYQKGAKFANTGTVLVNNRTGADMYARRGGKKYFNSEAKLQRYMLNNRIIGYSTYCMNIVKRWIVQCFLPNSVRGWVYRNLARTK